MVPSRAMQAPVKRAYKTSDSIYIKHGTQHEIQREVDAIFFVGRNTSIPVPHVIQSHIEDCDS